ncbi:MucB/RseB C-terminal domain-containing protein [Sinimarinibacterium thermocellulolyticum]|uniref:MucB/RseB C-terminal domain-containing protein n=1 Tax=Sinimarinibacterium thermocellulolyticum TaxID=3170016 RepID=A0ABV2A8M0_9GAMM
MSRIAGLALLLAAGAAHAEDPASMLVRVSEAAREVNYEGVVVYQGQNRLETLKVVHGFRDGVELERVEALTGAPREIVKRDGKVICLLPRDRKFTLDRPTPKGLFPTLTPERVAQLAAVYDFKSIGSARIAGRSCEGMAITPRDGFRYGYQIWADAQTHVPLKVNLIARDGRVLEQMMFTEVRFPEEIVDTRFDEALAEYEERKAVAAAEAQQRLEQARQAGWRFGPLPPGFRVTTRSLRQTADGRGIVEHVVLTDGLTAISVFSTQRHETSAPVLQGESRMGAMHAFGRVMGQVHITVVGEAPEETVRLIGESVQFPEGVVPIDAPTLEDAPRTSP